MRKTILLRRVLSFLTVFTLVVGTLVAAEYFGGQPMGLFAGSRPANLGYTNGRFAPPSSKPNNVSSTADASDKHFIAPLAFTGDAAAAWQKLMGIVQAMPRANVVSQTAQYAHVEFKSAGLGFIDDTEFALDMAKGVIHVRSGARLGYRDFNVNRDRVEQLRAQLSK